MKGRQEEHMFREKWEYHISPWKGRTFLQVTYVNKVCFCLKQTPRVLFIYITRLAPMHLRSHTPYTDLTLKKFRCENKACVCGNLGNHYTINIQKYAKIPTLDQFKLCLNHSQHLDFQMLLGKTCSLADFRHHLSCLSPSLTILLIPALPLSPLP